MASAEDNATLGQKHKHYNKLVSEAIANKKHLNEKEFTYEKNDLETLMKIDIANHEKDVEYIFSVLKSDDMLYVSRAIKQMMWLMDDQYADIICPKYLIEHLFPYMIAKAWLKLQKFIRQYIKKESRAELFYDNEKNEVSAAKWLPHCSVPFIETKIENHIHHLKPSEFKRLCEKSVTIFEKGMKASAGQINMLQATWFLLKTHADIYLDILENTSMYDRPRFGNKATRLIMSKASGRVINKFPLYAKYIHVPTFVKLLKEDELKPFLDKLAKENTANQYGCDRRNIFGYNITKHFINRMPKEEQYEFVRKVFLDKDNLSKLNKDLLEQDIDTLSVRHKCVLITRGTPIYYWYSFAPFNIAYTEIVNLIQTEEDINQKYAMLKFLLECAGTNVEYLHIVLVYYTKKHLKYDDYYKNIFIKNVLSRFAIYKYNDKIWNEFNKILISMNVYTSNTNNDHGPTVILQHVLHGKAVPHDMEKVMSYDDFKIYKKKLNNEEQNKIFTYLYNHIMTVINNNVIEDKAAFNKATILLKTLLDLILNWDKELSDYPFALNKIRELIRLRSVNSWDTSLSNLYKVKKSWKKLMFEESLVLHPSEDVAVNALKHDPGLLMRYNSDVQAMCRNDSISLKRVFKKLRIYWAESLADNWRQFYLGQIGQVVGQKALTHGLMNLLQKEPLHNLILTYAPKEAKIDWDNVDEATLGLQRSFAKNMHIARPQPSADAVLMYAKGDFLQYALPSILAIYYNMRIIQSQDNITKLLNSPVSLQKHGIRFAFKKLEHSELKHCLSNIWNTSKNASIRAVAFQLMYKALCQEKDAAKADELWSLFEVFIDNLTFHENKCIYEILSKVEYVHDNIKPKMLIKSYKFLNSLLPHVNKDDHSMYEFHIEKLAQYTREVMKYICPDFVLDIILEHTNPEQIMRIVSAFLLCAKDEDTQALRYEKVVIPLLKRKDIKIIGLLKQLARDINEYVIKNEMIIPAKLFTIIQKELEQSLSIKENYTTLTMWKLTVKITELIDKCQKRGNWNELFSSIVPEYAKYCLTVLEQDINQYFPGIYLLFSKALDQALTEMLQSEMDYLKIYELMLAETKYIPAYLVTIKCYSRKEIYGADDVTEKKANIRKIISNHPSIEVKMHYYQVFKDVDLD